LNFALFDFKGWDDMSFQSLSYLSGRLLAEAKKRFQELFEKYDVSGDGVLSQEVPFFSSGARNQKAEMQRL